MKLKRKRMMKKKILALFLALLTALSLCACAKNKYKPVPSTEEEKKTVFTLGEYEVPYELFRTFFLTDKEEIDGGDDSVWLGSSAAEYREKAIAQILPQIAEIYAMFTLCDVNGVDINADEIDEEIERMVTLSVEGGAFEGELVKGHGSYDAYLDYLKSIHMNDSVSRLIMRYSLCEGELLTKYEDTFIFENQDVYDFFEGDECAHVTWLFRGYYYSEFFSREADYELAEKGRLAMQNAKDYNGIINALVQYSSGTTDAKNIEEGFYIGKYTLDSQYMSEVIDAAFSLETGGISEVIENYYGAYVVYKMEKDVAYLENDENYERIAELYVNNSLYKKLEECKQALMKNVKFTEFFESLNFAEIEY